jgi:hypothetical protein
MVMIVIAAVAAVVEQRMHNLRGIRSNDRIPFLQYLPVPKILTFVRKML